MYHLRNKYLASFADFIYFVNLDRKIFNLIITIIFYRWYLINNNFIAIDKLLVDTIISSKYDVITPITGSGLAEVPHFISLTFGQGNGDIKQDI